MRKEGRREGRKEKDTLKVSEGHITCAAAAQAERKVREALWPQVWTVRHWELSAAGPAEQRNAAGAPLGWTEPHKLPMWPV